jgi:hypothetical protein
MGKSRGFKKLLLQRITDVDASSLNCVVLTTAKGDKLIIDCEVELSIPVLSLRKEKAKKK